MKNIKLIYLVGIFLSLFLLGACSDFLDELPDNRTDLEDADGDKLSKLLVSAYPATSYAFISETTSDNTDNNGGNWSSFRLLQEQAFLWKDVTEEDDDSPDQLWEDCYRAIAAANQVLTAIENRGNPAELNAQRGEALLCRAYAHFVLVNVFCKHYNTKTSQTDLGIPYMDRIETVVAPDYDRSNVAQVYKHIEEDIEKGLPLIEDGIYDIPKYHFNKKAAYAFATRFNLYYEKYDKVFEYAEQVLTSNPKSVLRDWEAAGRLSVNGPFRANEFISEKNKASLLLISCNSYWGYMHGPWSRGPKFTHNDMIAEYETCKSPTLWGSFTNLYTSIPSYQGLPKVVMSKIWQYVEYVDVVNEIIEGHIIMPAFTTDEILLCRAEAYILTKQYDNAVEDIKLWVENFTRARNVVSRQSINDLYGNMEYYIPTKPTPKKSLNPDFDIEYNGEQENFLHAILHMKRILSLHEGLRWFDVKRYGIEIYRRTVYNNIITENDVMKKEDNRRAIQLPQNVINAGMQANPR